MSIEIIGYRAIVLSGNCGTKAIDLGDGLTGRCREIRKDCGHKHKTPEAAEKCRQKQLNWSKDRKNCSAAWYNSLVVAIYRGYEDTHLGIYNS